jgi:hypothetical protein
MSILGPALAVFTGCQALVDVFDAVVVNSVEDGIETDGNHVEILQGDVAFVQLAV